MNMAKLKLNAGIDKISASKLKAVKKKKVSPKAISGTWVNCDRKTRGLVRVVLGSRGGTLMVQVFGACTPTPCDWGVVKGLAYSDSVSSTEAVAFSATYKFGFKTTIVTGHLEKGCMVIETYNHFTDSSGRCDYYSRECFCRH